MNFFHHFQITHFDAHLTSSSSELKPNATFVLSIVPSFDMIFLEARKRRKLSVILRDNGNSFYDEKNI